MVIFDWVQVKEFPDVITTSKPYIGFTELWHLFYKMFDSI